ncbi:unnamed protein product [Nesidiocoris tenuis]|uniref:Uncharacterized protein n=1 Tax=Nesidiocoris tenuis TaxID=355587 RepID=A0A6H5H2N2_9HEMI|nr:unnamed protein product [Nesidiocoris tenuis]
MLRLEQPAPPVLRIRRHGRRAAPAASAFLPAGEESRGLIGTDLPPSQRLSVFPALLPSFVGQFVETGAYPPHQRTRRPLPRQPRRRLPFCDRYGLYKHL